MNLAPWSDVLTSSFQDLWRGVIEFLPSLVVALVIFILGWIVGVVLQKAVAQIIRSLKFDKALRHAGFEEPINRAGFTLDAGKFVGALVKWFVIVAFLIASMDVLGLQQVNVFLQDAVLDFLPKVIVAVLILIVGVAIAETMERIVSGTARSAHMKSANFLGAVTRWTIWIFTGLAALYQLGVASAFVQTLFTGIVVALSLAFGLAFGLGGQDEARRYLKQLREEISHQEDSES
jgi:small-conductance mechanosensitive channel